MPTLMDPFFSFSTVDVDLIISSSPTANTIKENTREYTVLGSKPLHSLNRNAPPMIEKRIFRGDHMAIAVAGPRLRVAAKAHTPPAVQITPEQMVANQPADDGLPAIPEKKSNAATVKFPSVA